MQTKAATGLSFPVAGMTCQACAHTIERALSDVEGVSHAEVSYAAGLADVELDPGRAADELAPRIVRAVHSAGYSAPAGLGGDSGAGTGDAEADARFTEEADRAQLSALARNALLALLLGGSTVLSTLLGATAWISILLAGLTISLTGGTVLRTGWRALRRRAPDMNSLIALGSLSAFIAGAGAPLFPASLGAPAPHLRAAVMILALTLSGRWLEGRARRRAGGAVRALLELAPPTARILRGGAEREVALSEVIPGNLVLIQPGERIPVDGTIMQGNTSLDESLLTGESVPVERGPGEKVCAGTLNGDGALSIQATGIGRDSTLGRVAAAVRAAQGSRADVQELADRISRVFVPGVLAIACLSFFLWLFVGAGLEFALGRLITVLVVACPCALGLATPTAVVVASGRAASEGCLFRDARTLERLARVDTVIFDKTGTLTMGEPSLESIVPPGSPAGGPEFEEDRLLELAAAVERSSEQPLARAVVHAAEERGLAARRAEDVRAEPGRGVGGRVDGQDVWLGSPRAAAERGLDADSNSLGRLHAAGHTPVLLAIGGRLAATLGFQDRIRPTSAAAVRDLQQLGMQVHVMSGDHASVVDAIAEPLGIANRRGSLRPEEKASLIEELQSAGRETLMAGDGINDAVALSVASVGIAMGGGADVAIEAADGALLSNDPGGLPILLRLARRTLRIIRSNLSWAFAYNLLAIPLAAGALAPWSDWTVPPHVGAAAMSGSSLFVVLNSLRLRWIRLDA